MELFIVRHAWAGDYGDPQWPDDTLRPVTEKGKKRFADMAKLLVEHGVMPQIVVTSPMLRCRQTAEILAKAVPSSPEIIERDELLPAATSFPFWHGRPNKRRSLNRSPGSATRPKSASSLRR